MDYLWTFANPKIPDFLWGGKFFPDFVTQKKHFIIGRQTIFCVWGAQKIFN